MKKILITGVNSYIGVSFKNYIKEHYDNDYDIDMVSMVDGSWRNIDLSGYDSIFHVAGIAHSDNGKISPDKEKLYYAVNTDLTIEIANKAKVSGVKQFIFMSSSIVYGNSAPIGKSKVITNDTPVSPANCYGDSKVKAEEGLRALNNDTFKVVILRSPMVYGNGSKGNNAVLEKIALKIPIFPYIENERSMIYIDNLCEFVKLMIENDESGTFWPQNKEYSNTSDMVRMIADSHGKKIYIIRGFGWVLKIISCFTKLVNKAFGNLTYEHDMSDYSVNYWKYDLQESIRRTERNK